MKNKIGIVALSLAMLTMAAPALAATISTEMSIGSQSADVTTLQQTLALDPSIYPEARVTGYFGSLTRAAVVRFQAKYGISQVGRVGPQTKAKFNELYGGTSSTAGAPYISNVSVASSTGGVTLSWNTNKPASGIVFYSTAPLQLTEGNSLTAGPGISGNFLTATASATTPNTVVLGNLSSPATYYYMVQATDSSGNVSVSWPSTFVR
jgi:peptidoglycan hydrolase-like protein with peptidoglycan-binding domain